MPESTILRRITALAYLFILIFGVAACGPAVEAARSPETAAPSPTHLLISTPPASAQTSPPPTASPSPAPEELVVWLPDYLPARLVQELSLPEQVRTTGDPEQANLRLEIGSQPPGSLEPPSAVWIYAAAAAFPTTLDEISADDLHRGWEGRPTMALGVVPFLVAPETARILEAWWGPPGGSVRVVPPEALLTTTWAEQPSLAVLPFEEIQSRWKILRVDGLSPLDNHFDPAQYTLSAAFYLNGSPQLLSRLPAGLHLPTNRDPGRLTVLTMTGVTALSRHIGEVMEEKGVTYPAKDIGAWLASADLTHISNEVSFYQDCPKPGPERADMRFCSHPKYAGLLQAVGADIIELTGNHILDWGVKPFIETLDLYTQLEMRVYGGGRTLQDARAPLLVEHNGNRLAFIGCSPAGPLQVWATDDRAGSAPCQMDRLLNQVQELAAQGYLPVVTFQAVETDTYLPAVAQGMPDFRRAAKAGAVIVSGSQSHIPQTMTFVGDSFVHYGLGNLFFDQMKPYEARQAFIDRHVFYDGKYLGVELLTTLLEEYARPRPMTADERADFLGELFSLSAWEGE